MPEVSGASGRISAMRPTITTMPHVQTPICSLMRLLLAALALANKLLRLIWKFYWTSSTTTVGLKVAMNSSAIKIVKRKDREAAARLCTADASSEEKSGTREIVRTAKTWMTESRIRRQEEAQMAIQFI